MLSVGRAVRLNIFIILVYLILIVAAFSSSGSFLSLPFFILLIQILLAIFILRVFLKKRAQLELSLENSEEKLNLANERLRVGKKNNFSLKAKTHRYQSLKKIIEDISQYLLPEEVAEELSGIAFSVIANNQGNCNLFLFNRLNGELSLVKSKKEDKSIVMRLKGGDIFDHWVLRHSTPLIVEDAKKDFRFDLRKPESACPYPLGSLISSPFASGNNFLGIMRLDHSKAGYYSQDDLRFLATICDLGAMAIENSLLYQKTEDLAIHDCLTGIFTRNHLLQLLKEECRSIQLEKKSLGLLMIDIDDFKKYNDTFGHIAADNILKMVAQKISQSAKYGHGFCGRFGGEEFVVILPGAKRQDALIAAESLRLAVEEQKVILRRQETKITVSIGVSIFPDEALNETSLIQKADFSMYKAKQEGKNRIC